MQHLRGHGSGRGRALLGAAVLVGSAALLLGACGRARSAPVDTREITDTSSAPDGDIAPPAGEEPAPVSPSTDGESPPLGAELEPAEPGACPAELQFFPLGRPPENYYPRFDAIGSGSSYVFWSIDWGGNDFRVQSFRWTPELGNTALNELDEELPAPEGDEQIIDIDTIVSAVSSDGSTAVGLAYYNEERVLPGFRWRLGTGLELLDFPPSWVSRDGSVLVGWQNGVGSQNGEVLHWTETGGKTVVMPYASELLVSEDADVIVGRDTAGRSFRWTEATGSVLLGTFPGGAAQAQPLLLNRAGDVLVVRGTEAGTGLARLARWTAAGGIQALDGFPELTAEMFEPTAMSPDGRVLVGNLRQYEPPLERAFRWTEATGLQEIGPAGRGSQVTYVSPNAEVVFGGVGAGSNLFTTGFRWSEATGTEELTDTVQPRNVGADGYLLIGNALQGPFVRGFDAPGRQRPRLAELIPPGIVPSGWSNPVLGGISADGRLLVGQADNPQREREGWVMRLLEACSDP